MSPARLVLRGMISCQDIRPHCVGNTTSWKHVPRHPSPNALGRGGELGTFDSPEGISSASASLETLSKRARQVMPAIVLVEPKRGENIGAAARAMKNFGLHDLRLVSPVDGWPNERARAVSARAVDVLDAARLYRSLPDALSDLQYVYAASGRPRGALLTQPTVSSHKLLEQWPEEEVQVGIVFGREDNGLTNAELSLADRLLTIPSDPDFYSLNLGQAVVCVCYSLYVGSLGARRHDVSLAGRRGKPCRQHEVELLVTELVKALDARRHFTEANRAAGVAAVRGLLSRVEGLSSSDLGILRGVIQSLQQISGNGPQPGAQ